MPGKLEVTIKFNELPKPVQVQGGYKFGLDCDGKPVVVTLRPKHWNKLTQAASEYKEWIAALTGKMGEAHGNGFVLEQPALQVFERKPKGEGKTEAVSAPPSAGSETPAPSEASIPAPTIPIPTVETPPGKPVEPPARRPTLGLKNKTAS